MFDVVAAPLELNRTDETAHEDSIVPGEPPPPVCNWPRRQLGLGCSFVRWKKAGQHLPALSLGAFKQHLGRLAAARFGHLTSRIQP
jgi:hypothetical protein